MMFTPDITFLNETNHDVFHIISRDQCRAMAHDILHAAGWTRPCELTLTVCDNDTIQTLNKTHRGKDKPTNVLSFPAYDPADPVLPDVPVHLGDVVMAWDVMTDESTAQNKTIADHFYHLFVHGMLHLLGHDHQHDQEAQTMESIEISILAKHGIKNPYA